MSTESGNEQEVIYSNDWEKLPFRESMHLTHRLALVSWHDAQYIESYYQLAEYLKTDEQGRKHYKVICGFRYLSDLVTYLEKASLENYY